jgi:hypothetical protein
MVKPAFPEGTGGVTKTTINQVYSAFTDLTTEATNSRHQRD